MRGKGGMVWNIGPKWFGGDPKAQVAALVDLGLKWVAVKLADGLVEFWRNYTPAFIAQAKAAGIEVVGWGWTYGGWWDRRADPDKFYPDKKRARDEGAYHAGLVVRYGLRHFMIDAEKEYKRLPDPGDRLSAYVNGFRSVSNTELSLCSYRHPALHAPFPFHVAAGLVDVWTPQVYWEGLNGPDAGAEDLVRSVQGYERVGHRPLVPIGPLYQNAAGWRATPDQLVGFFRQALHLGAPAVGFWAIDTASPAQLAAIRDMEWPGDGGDIPHEKPLTDAEKLSTLWDAHPELHGG